MRRPSDDDVCRVDDKANEQRENFPISTTTTATSTSTPNNDFIHRTARQWQEVSCPVPTVIVRPPRAKALWCCIGNGPMHRDRVRTHHQCRRRTVTVTMRLSNTTTKVAMMRPSSCAVPQKKSFFANPMRWWNIWVPSTTRSYPKMCLLWTTTSATTISDVQPTDSSNPTRTAASFLVVESPAQHRRSSLVLPATSCRGVPGQGNRRDVCR